MKSALLASSAALALWGAVAPASAATYEFTISNEKIDAGSAILPDITFSVPTGGGFITTASGTINGIDVTGTGGDSTYDPIFGLEAQFYTPGVEYTFGIAGRDIYFDTAGDVGNGTFNFGAVSAVPLPAGLPMFGVALLGLGVVGYGLKRNRKITLPA